MKVSEIRRDYQSGPDNQMIDLSDPTRSKQFWEWFESRAIDLDVCDSPSEDLINDSNIPGRCYGNAQIITVNNGLEYYEGFVKNKDSFLMHGFNVSNGKVQDYTALSNSKDFTSWNGKPASQYCGVKIEKGFIDKYNADYIEQNYFNIPPLLEKLFVEEIS